MSSLINSIQHPYRVFGAKQKAAEQREMREAATDAATTKYADPRSNLTAPELRHDLESRTVQSETSN